MITAHAQHQRNLACVARSGDAQAFTTLIEQVKPFISRQVRKTITAFSLPEHAFDDLFSESVLQVYANLDKFDPERGGWMAFVFWWTRTACQAWARANADTVRESTAAWRARYQLSKARQALGDVSGTMLAQRTGVTPSMAERVSVPKRIELRIDDPDMYFSLVQSRTPEDDLMARETAKRVRRAMKKLKTRERYILKRRFGFDDPNSDGLTQQEIGDEFGVTRARIQQIEKAAIEKLRALPWKTWS